MADGYLIRALLGGAKKDFRCASAWIAFEQHNRLVRQGWKVHIFNPARDQITADQLEAAAQAEIGTAVNSEKSG
ncbi:hypothetical protein MKL09_26635 [Methylobacterium sp. J-048]|uniref:hypothetical protein n=1 Tax=Methylobacterium sp. J-048 TaxID=2836635 RepID=UPI001FB964EB|nr:hypothetical protein [Methylobacterium sp. J-048]MCJ2060095.1 hypothetical protein [Methylobacterium sp. J-048]